MGMFPCNTLIDATAAQQIGGGGLNNVLLDLFPAFYYLLNVLHLKVDSRLNYLNVPPNARNECPLQLKMTRGNFDL